MEVMEARSMAALNNLAPSSSGGGGGRAILGDNVGGGGDNGGDVDVATAMLAETLTLDLSAVGDTLMKTSSAASEMAASSDMPAS